MSNNNEKLPEQGAKDVNSGREQVAHVLDEKTSCPKLEFYKLPLAERIALMSQPISRELAEESRQADLDTAGLFDLNMENINKEDQGK